MRVFSLLDMPDGIGPAGTKTVGRWPKASAPMTRPGTILSQMPSIRAPSNMSWLSATAVRHGDHVAAEQRQLHADLALGDAVAHGGHAAGDLGHRTGLARGLADELGEALVGLMRREHVVVGGDDADVGPVGALELRPCRAAPQAAKRVGEVAAGQGRRGAGRARPWRRAAPDSRRGCRRCARRIRSVTSAMTGCRGMSRLRWRNGQWASSNQVRPSRSISAIAAVGPQLPAR